MAPRDNDSWFEDDELVREGGVLVSRSGGREVGCDEDECAPDDDPEDQGDDDGIPGTVDDVPYSYGVEKARAADEIFESFDRSPAKSWGVGVTGPTADGSERPLGEPEERELWQQQRALIDESEAEQRHYEALREDDVANVAEASAEDAEEVLPETPEGVSATGSASSQA
ncbi:MAG: hypothetical protein LLG08_05670 [Actinomycetia bacterium]|nr:hypothetical protein [Actinomycetes bacterium]